VSSEASLNQVNAWGINFHPPTLATPAGLTISRVVIDLQNVDTDARFDVLTVDPVISTRTEGGAPDSIYESPNGQDDTSGLSTAVLTKVSGSPTTTWSNSQVTFTYNENSPGQIVIDFLADDTIPDAGFSPGDRIRFGANVINLDPVKNGTNNDGDAVGGQRVKVTVTFAVFGTPQVPDVSGEFYNSNFRNCNAGNREIPPPNIDPCISGNAPFVLPPAPGSGNNNDQQSYVVVGAAAGNALGVRAQGTVNVNSVCGHLFHAALPVFKVSASATARYDCSVRRPELIRVTPENFLCAP